MSSSRPCEAPIRRQGQPRSGGSIGPRFVRPSKRSQQATGLPTVTLLILPEHPRLRVGRYVGNEADLEGAWRVLGSDGKARPDFRWGDPADKRDLQEVLASEGLAVSSNGIADRSKRLRRGELEKLLKT